MPATSHIAPRFTGGVRIDAIWSGVATGIGTATTRNGTRLFAYYDADRYLTLAALDPASGRITRRRLPSRFAGWDAHNAIIMAVGPDDTLHVAGNMHASPVVYAFGKDAADLATVRLAPMTGHDEAFATYPRFLRDVAGNLLFMYRDGGSGNGRWLLNRWNGAWARAGSLFADHDRDGPVSAYPTGFVRGPDGRFHVAVVWRRTPDVATNFALSYASTADFQTWRAGGRSVEGPLSPDTMATVDAPGENAGLVNNAALALDPAGRPIILYTRYGEGGRNAILAATPDGSGWATRAIATAPVRAEISGRGSIPDLPAAVFAGQGAGGRYPVHIALPQAHGLHDRLLDTARMTLIAPDAARPPAAADPVADALMARTAGMADVALHDMPVRSDGAPPRMAGRLRWYAQKANGDRPRACTDDAPRACAPPPSPLLWFPEG